VATSDDSDETAKAAERSADDNADDDPENGTDDDDGATVTAGTENASTVDVFEVGREGEEDEDEDETDDDAELMLVNGVGDKNPAHIYCLPVTRYSIGFINKASPGGTR